MLYRLLNRNKQSAWQPEYEQLYSKYLNIPIIDLNSGDDLSNLTEDDILWIQHYSDIDTEAVRETKAKKMCQVNGTAVNPYIDAVESTQEQKEYENIIDIALVFDEIMSKEMSKVYKRPDYMPIGFPIEVNKRPKHKKPQIVVAGRLDKGKMTTLNLWLTRNLAKNYEIIFCYPDNDKQEIHSKAYHPERFENTKFLRCSRDEWLDIASESEFYLITSLDDTGSVTIWEAAMLDNYILAPELKEAIPCYQRYISNGFEPYSRRGLEDLIINKKVQHVNFNQIDPKKCAQRLEKELRRKYENCI